MFSSRQTKGAPTKEDQGSNSREEPAAASAAEPQQNAPAAAPAAASATDDVSDDPNECGWCKWMKGGACKEQFTVWLKCVDNVRDAGSEDIEPCTSLMGPLWACMEQHKDYYAPQLESLDKRSEDKKTSKSRDDEGGVAGAVGDILEELQEAVEGVLDDDT